MCTTLDISSDLWVRVPVYFPEQVKRTVWRNFRRIEAAFFLTVSKEPRLAIIRLLFIWLLSLQLMLTWSFDDKGVILRIVFHTNTLSFLLFCDRSFSFFTGLTGILLGSRSRHLDTWHSRTTRLWLHKFSITRSQFLSIFYFHYAIMLIMYKWLHCLP